MTNQAKCDQGTIDRIGSQCGQLDQGVFFSCVLSGASDLQSVRAVNGAHAADEQNLNLPNLIISAKSNDHIAPPPPAQHGIFSDALHFIEHAAHTTGVVAEDLGKGALDEAINHPDVLLKDAAIGAGIGLAIAAAPVLTVPVLALTAIGLIANRKHLIDSAVEFGHDVAVVYDPQAHSSEDAQISEKSLEGFGGTGAQVVAGVLGGVAGGYLGSALRSAVVAESSAATTMPAGTQADASAAASTQPDALGPTDALAPTTSEVNVPRVHVENGVLVDDSGALKGFQFNAIPHNGVQDFKDTWTFNGTPEQAEATLEDAGFVRWRSGFHLGDTEYRLPATGRESLHFNVEPGISATAEGAPLALGNAHGYEYYPGTHMLLHLWHDVLRVPD